MSRAVIPSLPRKLIERWPMKRQLFVISVLAALAGGESCGGSDSGLTAPTGPTYTISGAITEYHGGPVTGVTVTALACNAFWGITCYASTNQQGRYNLSSPGAAPTGLAIGKEGYQTAWKSRVSAEDSTANFVLLPHLTPLNPDGATLAGAISGDEFIAGDDVLFGGLCDHTACKVIEFAEFGGRDRQVEVRLRWTDPARQLALYRFGGQPDSIPARGQPAQRYCCSSDVVATIYVSGYFAAIAVAFEQAESGPPGPTDSQPFELTVRSIP